jgi:hypothetical protein
MKTNTPANEQQPPHWLWTELRNVESAQTELESILEFALEEVEKFASEKES